MCCGEWIAFFRCQTCNREVEVSLNKGTIQEPQVCDNCLSKFSMKLIHNRYAPPRPFLWVFECHMWTDLMDSDAVAAGGCWLGNDDDRSNFADKQLVRLQENPDTVPEGETPHTITLCTYDDLVDVARPGDRVVITGTYRPRTVRALVRSCGVLCSHPWIGGGDRCVPRGAESCGELPPHGSLHLPHLYVPPLRAAATCCAGLTIPVACT